MLSLFFAWSYYMKEHYEMISLLDITHLTISDIYHFILLNVIRYDLPGRSPATVPWSNQAKIWLFIQQSWKCLPWIKLHWIDLITWTVFWLGQLRIAPSVIYYLFKIINVEGPSHNNIKKEKENEVCYVDLTAEIVEDNFQVVYDLSLFGQFIETSNMHL